MGARRVLLQAVRGLARAHLINLQPLLRPTVDETSRSRFSRVGVALRRCGFASSPDTFFQEAGLARAHSINLQPLLLPTEDEISRPRFSRVGVALRSCGFASSPDTFIQEAG
jgi:hypothetical protein